jgi:general secretion pathway protein A
MAKAGLPDQTVISPELIEEIHFRSQGIPRLINAICDNLMLTAFALETKSCTLAMLDEVTADMRLDYPGRRAFREGPDYPVRAIGQSHLPYRVD